MGPKHVTALFACVLMVSSNSVVDKKVTETSTENVAKNSSNIEISKDTLSSQNVSANNVANVELSDNSLKYFEEDLYNHIVFKRFDKAVNLTLSLYSQGYSNVVRNVAHSLLDNGYPQVIDYAYKVTSTGPWRISRDCFPIELRIQEDLVFVRIINNRYDMALKYGDGEDWDGDKIAYGDPNTETRFKITWKFIPVWSDTEYRVFFKLRPINRAYFLKLGNTRDLDGDHGAYGSKNSDSDRHLWYLRPEKHNGKQLFFIINKEYDELLKLGQFTDSDDDRKAYGHSKRDYNAEYFGWEIDVL